MVDLLSRMLFIMPLSLNLNFCSGTDTIKFHILSNRKGTQTVMATLSMIAQGDSQEENSSGSHKQSEEEVKDKQKMDKPCQ